MNTTFLYIKHHCESYDLVELITRVPSNNVCQFMLNKCEATLALELLNQLVALSVIVKEAQGALRNGAKWH